jgi:hypothetical protein
MKNIKLWQLMGLTFVSLYVIIGFVMWEWDWIKHLSTASSMGRLWFFLGVVIKLIIDVMLWIYLKEEPTNKQKELDKQAESYVDKRGLDEYNQTR